MINKGEIKYNVGLNENGRIVKSEGGAGSTTGYITVVEGRDLWTYNFDEDCPGERIVDVLEFIRATGVTNIAVFDNHIIFPVTSAEIIKEDDGFSFVFAYAIPSSAASFRLETINVDNYGNLSPS